MRQIKITINACILTILTTKIRYSKKLESLRYSILLLLLLLLLLSSMDWISLWRLNKYLKLFFNLILFILSCFISYRCIYIYNFFLNFIYTTLKTVYIHIYIYIYIYFPLILVN